MPALLLAKLAECIIDGAEACLVRKAEGGDTKSEVGGQRGLGFQNINMRKRRWGEQRGGDF